MLRINHNLSALNTTRLLNANTRKQASIAEKLSSGYRINRAGDNAAGLSISEKMRAQIRGLNEASRNAQDGISLVETADGALNEIHNIAQRIRELSVQAANGTSTEEDKGMIQTEINQLTEEIDRISRDTEFNNIKLLDGSLESSHESGYISLDSLLNSKSDGLNIIYVENNFITEQRAVGGSTGSNTQYNNLKNILKTEIVPQAVSKILNTYSEAFGYLNSSSIGIGLAFKNDSNSGELASLGSGVYPMNNNCVYRLTINLPKVLDNHGNIKSREQLEAIVAHEFIHGFMDEALTCGMSGYDSSGKENNNNRFPLWFVEGMAQTASGGYANFNDFVNGNGSLNIKSSTSIERISEIVKSSRNRLDSSKEPSAYNGVQSYGTGYLACMYLGYLANGANDISEKSITTGLNHILKDMISGKSLDTVIKEKSNGKYSGVSDFQNKFGDNDSSKFIKELTIRVGEGNGSLVSGDYSKSDILPDNPISISLFNLNTDNDMVLNIYPRGVKLCSGGGTLLSGNAPIEGYGEISQSSGGSGDTPIVNPPLGSDVTPGNKVDLSNITSIDGIDYDRSSNTLTVTKNGDYTLSGINNTGTKVVVQNGVQANITLDNAKINTNSGDGINLEGNANVTLKLKGNNNITSTAVEAAGIAVKEGSTLNIEGDGKLKVQGGEMAAGIGGSTLKSAGTINIKSGEVEAQGGENAAGIGGGLNSTGGNINISGGIVKATGGDFAAGIGGGSVGDGGNINITGGTINSIGGIGGAGIGGGAGAEAGTIKVDGESAIVVAKAGRDAENIGSGANKTTRSGRISIDKGVISDGVDWSVQGQVVIKTTIKISGTFTSKRGSTITIVEGGSIGGTGSIKVESGSTIKVESGGVIDTSSTINNQGNINNRGKITTPCNSDSEHRIKNYVNKIFNDIEKQLKVNIGQTLQSSIGIPKIQVLCNGQRKELQCSNAQIFDSSNTRITNLSDVTVNRGDRFTYKVSFNLNENSDEYFDENGVTNNSFSEHNYSEITNEHNYGRLLSSEVSNGGKTITYTYALEAADSSAEPASATSEGKLKLQIGANYNQVIGIDIDGMSSAKLGLNSISVTTPNDASRAINSCDEAIKKVSSARSKLGAYQNRLEHSISNLDNSSENLQASESRIRDLDIAKGMAEYSKYQILTQVDQAILSQANQMANSILNLLRA